MKQLLATLLFLLISIQSFSQIKCKLLKAEMDSFTGQAVIVTKWQNIGKSEKLSSSIQAQLTKKGDSVYILRLWAGGGGLGCITTTSQVHFKTTMNEIRSITHAGEIDCGSTVYVSGTSVKSNPVAVLVLNQDDVDFLKKSIAMIRMEFDDFYGNYNVTMPMNLQQLFVCVDSTKLK
jgi:hypothetical protein